MPNYEVVLKTVPAQLIASRRVTIPTNDQVPEYLNPAFGEVFEHVGKQGAKPTSPAFAIWHQSPEVLENEVAEAAVVIDRAIPASDRVTVYELPGAQMASFVHHGPFEDFQQGHTALFKWVEANGYRVVGPYREIYIQHNPDDLSESATEIQYPVEKL